MDTSPLPILFGISLVAACSAVAGCIAYAKRRSPTEGVLLGLLLGPIGILIECLFPYAHRPPVDKNAWDSFRSLMAYQESVREMDGRRSGRSG
jgi:hypothetical protein